MAAKLTQAIYDKLFVPGGKRFVVALNRDGVLLSDEVKTALMQEFSVEVCGGDSLDLRIVRETKVRQGIGKVLFVATDTLDILEDIENECEQIVFQFKTFFPHQSWEVIKQQPYAKLCKAYEHPGYYSFDDSCEEKVLSERGPKEMNPEEQYNLVKLSWSMNKDRINFNKPTEWMDIAAEKILKVIELEKWNEFAPEIKAVNDMFLEFLKENYISIVSSTCGTKYPKIVTQVLPFISKQKDEKVALVVVDGMNYWQALLLTRSLEERLGVKSKYDCIYAWLPSVTELSRQAIFRGDTPYEDYVQSPANEAKLWKTFWNSKRIPEYEQYYQHSGVIEEEHSVKKVGYVVVDLDEKMHASEDFMYLYDNTKRWVKDEQLLANIKHLVDGGYKIYITTDHGNIETTGYRRLDSRDKLGADLSNRHITIPKEADKGIFEAQYDGHLCQVDKSSRTYYAVDKEAFCSTPKSVTHGGTHWLEVLIPFITIE